MALSSIFTNKGNFIGEIEIDVIVSESATSTATITKNPVENGADINDHIIIEPMTFSITGVVSNSGIGLFQNISALANLVSDKTKSQATWDDLLKLQSDREPFTLVQGLKTYDNVVIQSLTETQDKTTAGSLSFTATLVEINLVGTVAPPNIEFGSQETSDQMTPATDGGLRQVV